MGEELVPGRGVIGMVLLVEAEEGLTTLYGHFLKTAGFGVTAVRAPGDAIQHVRWHGKPGIVLADVSTASDPDEQLQQLRGAVGNVPIVAIVDTYRPEPRTSDWALPNDFAVSAAGTLLRGVWQRLQAKHRAKASLRPSP